MTYSLNFTENDLLGSVTYVDTEQIVIEIENLEIMTHIRGENLVAIEIERRHKQIIALIH